MFNHLAKRTATRYSAQNVQALSAHQMRQNLIPPLALIDTHRFNLHNIQKTSLNTSLRRPMIANTMAMTSVSKFGFANHSATMSKENADHLHILQESFEQNPQKVDRAYELFTELNRHGMHLTVVRLAYKHDLLNSSVADPKHEQMRSQYEYARDNLDETINREVSGSTSSGEGKQSLNQKMVENFAHIFVEVALLIAFFYFASQMLLQFDKKSFGNQQFQFDIKKPNEIDQRLDDVKGIDEIKGEIQDLIHMIKNPVDYTSKGAKLHKGVLLFGAPGTGKTLLSRAIAGEAGTTFIYCTGSTFDEMYVGVGAKRVRELFTEARKHTPCIIFIDEIDTLLSKSRRFGSEHSSSRATINQVLTELDGFNQNQDILVIGATNHQADLDPAAVRPGRFDKKIAVPAPDINGRTDIFNIYLDKIERDTEIEAKKLATMTPGFTGAEIENLVNTAITEAVHRGKDKADLNDFEFARDRIMMGIERKKLSMSEKERLNTSIHECGHTIVCYHTKGASKLYKATIVARGGSLGATYMVPNESDSLSTTKEKVLAFIDVAMGGHVAEELFIGSTSMTTGCGSDLERATKHAYNAVRKYGMFGEDAGYISSDKNALSEKHNASIDIKVQQILKESKARVTELLLSKENQIRDLSIALYKYDYLDKEEIETIMQGGKLDKVGVREFDYQVDDYAIKWGFDKHLQ